MPSSNNQPGWFSRRHRTRHEHDLAVANYGTRADRKARRQGVAEANEMIAKKKRSPKNPEKEEATQ